VSPRPRRSGVTLVELLVSLAILGIVSAGALRMLSSQTRFVDLLVKQRSARAVTRASMNLMLSELRNVEATGGVVRAGARAVTVYAPVAMGMACGPSGTATVVSVLPFDSAQASGAGFAGYAWREGGGGYAYETSGASAGAGDPAVCAAASIRTLAGGRVVAVSPPLPPEARAGTPVLLLQQLRYEFAASDAFAGRVGLFRSDLVTGAREEIAAPFDSTVRFRFYREGVDTALAAPPADLTKVRGLQLVLAGESTAPRVGGSAPERARQNTTIYFANHP
jgi:prepilin-type N-terminal cleavage/methylation domain-containing protein